MECVIPGGGLFPHMTASRNLTPMARRPSLLCYCAAFLPIVWNTQAGLLSIDPAIIESARDMVPAEGEAASVGIAAGDEIDHGGS